MSDQAGRESGGDLMDMAAQGTTVPEDSAKPRLIPSKPRPDEIADSNDPNYLGGTNPAEAATNAGDIPRSTKDKASVEAVTGTGDALPAQIDSKRLHNVPGGVTQDPLAKGSTRMTNHKVQEGDANAGGPEGGLVEKPLGDEKLSVEEATDKVEGKV